MAGSEVEGGGGEKRPNDASDIIWAFSKYHHDWHGCMTMDASNDNGRMCLKVCIFLLFTSMCAPLDLPCSFDTLHPENQSSQGE